MWLTTKELSHELRVSPTRVVLMRKRGQLAWINLGTGKTPSYRYQLPKIHAANPVPAIERVAFLTTNEAAELLGVNRATVRSYIFTKTLKRVMVGKRAMISVAELRRFLAIREKRRGQDKQSYSPLLMKWLREYLDSKAVPVQVLELLLQEAVKVGEPEKSRYVTLLWDHFDKVNALLKEIEDKGRDGAPGETRTLTPRN
jgi:excisionase family DNA binding protein